MRECLPRSRGCNGHRDAPCRRAEPPDEYGHGLQRYPLWVARYGKGPGQVTAPADWKTWTIHQYADAPVDQNVSALTPVQLKALGRR